MSVPAPDPIPEGEDAFPVVYQQLRRLAHRALRAEADGHTLDTTALVHEAYLRLAGQREVRWHDRGHFLALASMAMRRILVDHARRHRTTKRGAGLRPVTLDRLDGVPVEARAEVFLALDEALARLAALDPRQARVIECRFFGGLTEDETADALGVSPRTVKRDWAKARSWLYAELYPDAVG
jgi:RNA polymerase sigma factor (TIGR02999 family)